MLGIFQALMEENSYGKYTMTKLTKRSVESAEIKEKPYFLFDGQINGFCIRISHSGKRHYYLQYLKYKTVKRFAIGQHGIIIAENSRDKAR